MIPYVIVLSILIVVLIVANSATAHDTDGTGFVTLVLNAPASTTNYYSVCGDYTYFKVNMPYPCSDLNIQGTLQLL